MDFKELEQERLKRLAAYKKRGNIGLIVMLCGIAVGVGGFFLLKVNENFKIMIILGLLALGVGIGIFSSKHGIASKYAREFKKPVVEALLKKWYDVYSYDERGGMPLAEIYNSGLLTRRADRWHTEDLIEGMFNGVQFRTSDVHLEEEHTYTDSKGNTHTEWITFFRGRWYQFFLNRDFETIIRIKEKKRIKEMITRGLEKVEVESIGFNDKFMAYAMDDHKFFYIFSPVVIEKMLELEKMHRGQFMFSLDGNIVNIGINDNRDYLELNLKTALTEENIGAYESQINLMAAIIKEFRFDSYKFQQQTGTEYVNNAIHVDEADMAEFMAHDVESKMENLDNIVEAKLDEIDKADNPDYAAEEIDRIDEELEGMDEGFNKM
ncbi:MAG: DUF3137 domain-containing protein [bacterium]|nr:DUF3137 domain-containing protein [bacterium]